MKVLITGQKYIPNRYRAGVVRRVEGLLDALCNEFDVSEIVTGMTGVSDLLAGRVAVERGIPLALYSPRVDVSRWYDKDRREFERLLGEAVRVREFSDASIGVAFSKRNRAMVDDTSLAIVITSEDMGLTVGSLVRDIRGSIQPHSSRFYLLVDPVTGRVSAITPDGQFDKRS